MKDEGDAPETNGPINSVIMGRRERGGRGRRKEGEDEGEETHQKPMAPPTA
jgi:hypothetical protein